MKPNTSIILSVHGQAPHLKKAILSVLNQTEDNFELIIIDDHASKSAKQNIMQIKDQRVIVLKNNSNLGLTKSLNKGIKHARGKYIARIDADDTWDSKKLEKQLLFLKKNPDVIVIGTNSENCNYATNNISIGKKPQTDSEIRKILPFRSPFIHPSIIFRNIGLKYDESFTTSQDYELYTRLLKKGKGYNLQETLTKRITHEPNSISLNKWKTQRKNKIKIRKLVIARYNLPKYYYIFLMTDIVALTLPKKFKKLKQLYAKKLSN